MKLQAKAGSQFAALDDSDAGEGLAIFFSQSLTDSARWIVEVSATLDTGRDMLVGTFAVSPPNATLPLGKQSRQVAAAVCPGAKTWSCVCYPAGGPIAANPEAAQIELTSSKCCTAPVGLTRVSQRQGLISESATAAQTLNVLEGQVITRITCVGQAGGGTLSLLGTVVTVAAGTVFIIEPKAPIPAGVNALAFFHVNWAVEYLESA